MPDSESITPNERAPWSDFDADAYWKSNYATVLPEDAQILQFASRFLIDAREGRPLIESAVDVGAGTNLYPALLMLPWTKRIDFTEYAPTNIGWLSDYVAEAPGAWGWQSFWDILARLPEERDRQ